MKIKKFLAVFIALVCTISSPYFSVISNALTDCNSKKYEEYHDQINFDTLTVFSVNKKHIVVEIDPSISWFKKAEAKKQKIKYEEYIKSHPESEKELLDSTNSFDQVCVISYTDAPLEYKDDHYERVLKSSNNLSPLFVTASAADLTKNTENPSPRGNLTLTTTVIRRGVSNPYTYHAYTKGTWDNSALSGQNAPAAGNDFVAQSCPTVTKSSSFSSTYNYSTSGSKNGQNGKNYFLSNSGKSWVEYEVVDDPVGLAQLHTFCLTQTFSAKSTSATKKINSYYIHTWKSMSVSVSVGGNAGLSGDEPSAGVSLNLTPSLSEKFWRLSNFVSFNW